MLKIALLGACPERLAELSSGLNQLLAVRGRHLQLVAEHDPSALPASLAGCNLVLLAGLEAAADAPINSMPRPENTRKTADAELRSALTLAAVSYRVLYGTAAERLDQALLAVDSLATPPVRRPKLGLAKNGVKKQPWTWMCDKCSDPQCEHRLLSDLLQARASAA
ncbi:MAG: hypothetical protein JWR74_1267 [Polaromonas sp.]|jgi:hypothetical protein|nr:hypothetical protein [Polaromonas sp.]